MISLSVFQNLTFIFTQNKYGSWPILINWNHTQGVYKPLGTFQFATSAAGFFLGAWKNDFLELVKQLPDVVLTPICQVDDVNGSCQLKVTFILGVTGPFLFLNWLIFFGELASQMWQTTWELLALVNVACKDTELALLLEEI
jgi:hypothetical protein